MTDPQKPPRTRIMGIRDDKTTDGEAQYGGSFGGGASGGGAYATPHGTDADMASKAKKPAKSHGGQSVQGYYGGGQAAGDNSGTDDHHAASRGAVSDDSDATYRDHPSQQDDTPAEDAKP